MLLQAKEPTLVNCKLITSWHQNSEPGSRVVWVLYRKKLPLQELNQLIGIRLLTKDFLEIFGS